MITEQRLKRSSQPSRLLHSTNYIGREEIERPGYALRNNFVKSDSMKELTIVSGLAGKSKRSQDCDKFRICRSYRVWDRRLNQLKVMPEMHHFKFKLKYRFG